MSVNLVRFEKGGVIGWGVAGQGGIAPLKGRYETTRELIETGMPDWQAAQSCDQTVEDVKLLSPITRPARIVCQGANYRQHMIESGLDPDERHFNMFFEKSDASINGPVDDVIRPTHVRLLDYEVELGLVFGKPIQGPVRVTPETYGDYIFGLVMANDVSARDIQIPETQFFKGKSYRTFCPMGPYLVALEGDERRYIEKLNLKLSVNGTVRQDDSTSNMVNRPADTITELSTFSNMDVGDVLLTGTPAGCALRPPKKLVQRLARALLSEPKFYTAFKKGQARRPQYLQPGDVMTAEIRSDDGRIDLGTQTNRIVEGSRQLDRSVSKFQHHVFYVTDLERSKDFFSRVFDLQLSARNHPDSSAGMRLAKQEMQFYSFGYYHHDICLVKLIGREMDNGSMLHLSLKARDSDSFERIRDNVAQLGTETRDGRMLASANLQQGQRAFCFRDPDNHWFEVIEELAA